MGEPSSSAEGWMTFAMRLGQPLGVQEVHVPQTMVLKVKQSTCRCGEE